MLKIRGDVKKQVVVLGGAHHKVAYTAKSEYTVRVSWSHVFNNPRQGRAHKLISFIVFLHVLKASASNGSKNKKW